MSAFGTRRLAPRARTAGWLKMAPRGTSRAALWCQRLAVFLLFYLPIVVAGHRFGLIETPGAFWLLGLAVALLAVCLVLGAAGFHDLWTTGARGGMRALRGMALAGVLLLPFLYGGYLAFTRPPLNDVSTDLADPPEFSAAGDDRTGAMNRIEPLTTQRREAQIQAYPGLAARSYSGDIDRVFRTVFELVRERDWLVLAEDAEPGDAPVDVADSGLVARPTRMPDGTLIAPPVPRNRPDPDAPAGAISGERVDVLRDSAPEGDLSRPRASVVADDRYVEAVATSPVMGFESDVVIRLVEEGERTVVDMRAASRHGRHDLGANAALVQDFLAELDEALQGLAGE